jgi:hypothetical protein
MMNSFLRELFKGTKWVSIAIFILTVAISVFVGSAWSLGWLVDRLFDLNNFDPGYYISFGSAVLVFTLIIQIITIIITIWALLAYGKSSRGIIQKKDDENAKGN